MKKVSNIVETDHGLYEKYSGHKIVSPLDIFISSVKEEMVKEIESGKLSICLALYYKKLLPS